ncbi:LysR family transcriptional regulator [Cohnella candidum]|uniref:LysR family transcriptional regulator n=1 Tax=Cohnella candidum TaxID=2674991 RepID=A0A3G3JY35_9BACL|nr:LysR family transcriptional regulator [Cohnella candidum]AYQ73072.1 LysR family transcriptional regulator [Cohnella candidum]
MELRNLAYVLEVAKQKNMTKAAEVLNTTQPNLSKIIKNIEAELGVTLFDRSGKTFKLTDSGASAVGQFRAIVESVNDLHARLHDISTLENGSLLIGLPPVISSVFFPRVVAPFKKKYPKIEIRIVEEGAQKVEQLVRIGELDLGVVVAPVEDEQLGTVRFLEQKLFAVLNRRHPCASDESVALASLRDDPFILFPQGFSVRKHVVLASNRLGFDPSIAFESAQWDLLAEMVASNMGVSFLPEAICAKVVNPEVRLLPLTDPVIPWNLRLIWNKERYVSYAIKEFVRQAEDASGMA